MKSDRSIRNICIAAIKRHTVGPIDFPFSRIFETEVTVPFGERLSSIDGELPVSQTFIDEDNWTLTTTRRIASCHQGKVRESAAERVRSWHWGAFNVTKGNPISFGELELDKGDTLRIHIERGKVSMITIYAIMTQVGQLKQ
jgi:hypothetical protein